MTVGWHLYGFVTKYTLGVISDQSGFVFERDPDTCLDRTFPSFRRDRVPMDEDVLSRDRAGSRRRSRFSIANRTVSRGKSLHLPGDAASGSCGWSIPCGELFACIGRTAPGRRLSELDVVDGEDVLPGFQLAVAELFA